MKRGGLLVLGILAVATLATLVTGSMARSSNRLEVAGAPLGPAVLSWPSINPSAVSTSWYCALAPAAAAGGAESVVVINPSHYRERFQIGAVVGRAMRSYQIGPYSSATFPRPRSGGVSILSKGAVVAEVTLSNGSQVAPCTGSLAADWLAGGLGTQLGRLAVVQVYNPFPKQAIVDIAGLTATGTVSLPRAQGLIIPPGGTATVKANAIVPGETGAALQVNTKAGRVAVSELAGVNSNGVHGLTYEPGQAAPAAASSFLYIATAGLSSLHIDLANPSSAAEQVNLVVRGYRQGASHEAVLQRKRSGLRVAVPAGATVEVDLTAQATQRSALAVSVGLSARQGIYAWASIEERSGNATLFHSALPQVLRSSTWVVQCANPGSALLPLSFSAGVPNGPVKVRRLSAASAGRAPVFATSLVAPGVISVPSLPSGFSLYRVSAPKPIFVSANTTGSCLSLPVATG